MKTKLSTNHISFPEMSFQNDAPVNSTIDATLAIYAKAEPDPGFESRITSRISQSHREFARAQSRAHWLFWRRLSVGALAAATACGIVIGTVRHSRHALPPEVVRATPGSSTGASPATASHTPTHAIPVSPQIDPSSPRTPAHERAQISHNPTRHPNGVATPRSPYPPDQQPGSDDKPQR
jgi:hypothetical protein